jgi:hypothetical protein
MLLFPIQTMLSIVVLILSASRLKNRLKTVGFCENWRNRFTPILSVLGKSAGEFKINFFKKIEIKILKKIRCDFKSFGQNIIQKIEATRSAKFVEVKIARFS